MLLPCSARRIAGYAAMIFTTGCLLYSAVPAGTSSHPPTAPFATAITPFLSRNCLGCHSDKVKSGGLNLKQYESTASVLKDRDDWENVLRRVKAGEMPPKGLPRPGEAETKTFTSWLEAEFQRADAGATPDPGRVSARRLNRNEYNNTVRDLLGVHYRPADDFPQDDSAHGFDNIADALTLSPTLMEKYMAAAERISKTAVFGPELKSTDDRYYPPTPRRMENNPVVLTQPTYYSPKNYDVTGLAHPGSYFVRREFPVDGEYIVRLYANGGRPPGSEAGEEALWLDGKIVKTFEVPDVVTAGNERAQVPVETRVRITAGKHELAMSFLHQFEGLPPAFGGLNPSTKPVPPGRGGAPALPPLPADATPQQIAERKALLERIQNRAPRTPKFDGLYAYQFDIEGPLTYKKGPSAESLQKIYSCGHLEGHHQPSCRRVIVSTLARRAFRKPVAAPVVDQLVAIAADATKRSGSFEDGIAIAIQALLVSPDFLFRIEPSPAPRAGVQAANFSPVSNYDLASRLSYFLWSSMPDDQLLRRASQGTLRDPRILDIEVRRMLKDPKSNALVENFGGQWLETRRLESMLPDRDRFPDFEDYLRYSMVQETELFFKNILHEDASILDFIDGKYAFLNERLARHYGIPGVLGPEFRRVNLSSIPRGGVLGQASVLTVSSFVNRTSPVVRGKWVLENLLNSPPPPPPPDVPSLDEEKVGANASLRETLEIHRKNAVCASCHSRMDPLGFALENYDAVGAWRTADGKFPVDASGALPDGRKLDGAAGLKAILMTDKDVFTRALTERMLTYALGRGLERPDRLTVNQVVATTASRNYKISGLILAIVDSVPFRNQRSDKAQQETLEAQKSQEPKP